MSLDHWKSSVQRGKKKQQKQIPKPKRSALDLSSEEYSDEYSSEEEYSEEERDTESKMHLFTGLIPPLSGSRTGGVPKRPRAGKTMNPDLARAKNVDSFLDKLGQALHTSCREDMQDEDYPENMQMPMDAETIGILYRVIYRELPEQQKWGISPELEKHIVTALSRVPRYLFAEKDPDHLKEEEIPDIKELLALDAYLQQYEQTNPEGRSDEFLEDYHRGADGRPDFVYQNGSDNEMKSYDPLRLPRDGNREDWMKGTFKGHAGGKNTGAVCILDVSDATDADLAFWIKQFTGDLSAIAGAIEANKGIAAQHEELIKLCNTYAVSYRENADGEAVKALQKVFDDAREFLQARPYLQQLDVWRAESSKPVEVGDLFDDPPGW